MSYHKIIHRMEVKETNQTSILNPKTTPKYFHRYKHDVAYSLHTQLYKQIVRTISYIHLSIWNKNNQFILHFIKAYDNIPWFYEAAFAVETCEQWPTTTCVVDLLHFVEETATALHWPNKLPWLNRFSYWNPLFFRSDM